MSDNNIYDPEDLEKLLSSKSFSELLPEEKAFVLQFVDNDAEYDGMKNTYQLLGTTPEIEPAIEPRDATKVKLMEAFVGVDTQKETSRLAIFWNWFWDTNKALLYRPALQLASVIVIFGLGYYIAMFNPTETLAEATSQKTETKKETSGDSEKSVKTKTDNKKEAAVVENEKAQPNSDEKIKDIEVIEKPEVVKPSEVESKNGIIEVEANSESTLNIEEDLAEEELFEERRFENELEKEVPSFDIDATNDFADDLTDETGFYKPDVILDDETGKNVLITDDRASTGNAISTTYSLEEIESTRSARTRSDTKFKKSLEAKDAEGTPALNASNFSKLLSKLYTAE